MGFGARKSHNAPNNIIQSANMPKIRDEIKIHGVDGERKMDHVD